MGKKDLNLFARQNFYELPVYILLQAKTHSMLENRKSNALLES